MDGEQGAVQRALDRVAAWRRRRARRGSRGPRRRRSGRTRRRGTPRAPRGVRRRRSGTRVLGPVERGLGDVDRQQRRRSAREPLGEHADRAPDLEPVGESPAFQRRDRGVVLRRLVRARLELPRVRDPRRRARRRRRAQSFAHGLALPDSAPNRNSRPIRRITLITRSVGGRGVSGGDTRQGRTTCLIGERSSWARSRLRCACPRPPSRLDEVNTKKLRDGVTVNGILQHERALSRSPTPTAAPARRARRATRPRCSTSRTACRRPAIASRSRSSRSRSSASSRPPCWSRPRRRRRTTRPARSTTPAAATSPRSVQEVDDNVFPPHRRAGHDRRGLRGARLRRLHRRQHRADPARVLRLRASRPRTPRPPAPSAVIIFNEGQDGRAGALRRHARRAEGHPGRRPQLRGRRGAARAARRRCRDDARHDRDRGRSGRHDQEPDRRHQAGQRGRDRRRRRAPRLRRRGPGHQRQRLRHGDDPRDRRGHERAEDQAAPRACASRFWGAEESGLLGSEHYVDHAARGPAGPDLREPQLRHGRLAQLRPLRLRRRRLGHRTAGPPGSAQIEAVFNDYFAGAGPGARADGVRRPLRLRPVHRGRHPGRRPVHRRRGRQDRRAGGRATAAPPASPSTPVTTRPATR